MSKYLPSTHLLLLIAATASAQTSPIPEPNLPIQSGASHSSDPSLNAPASANDDSRPPTERELLDALNASSVGSSITFLHGGRTEDVGTHQPSAHARASGDSQDNGPTEIIARLSAFDEKGYIAVFTKEVYVENPQFTVNCDKLTAYLHTNEARTEQRDIASQNKAAARAAEADPEHHKFVAKPVATPRPTPRPKVKISEASSKNATQEDRDAVANPPKIQLKPTGGLEQAICEGSVVVVQDKVDPDGTVTRNIGHARKAIYFADSGDIYLFGSPDVEQGINTCVATEDQTVMILNRDGHMTVNGLHRSIVKDSGPSDAANPKE